MIDSVRKCALCGNETVVARVVLSLETRGDSLKWTATGEPETWPLCPAHWAWWEEHLRSALNGPGAGRQLGVPGRPDGSQRLHPNLCDTCVSRHGRAAWSFEVLPRGEQLRKLNMRALGSSRKVRLCRHCAMWWRLQVREGRSPEARDVRTLEGESGSWLQQANADVLSFGLQERDTEVLAKSVEATGNHFTETLAPLDTLRLLPEAMLFVGAMGWPRQAFQQMKPTERRRVVCVSGPDHAEETKQALLRGAGDFLASPISPQQVAGAFQRVLARPPLHRHPSSGLPVFAAQPRADWGQPAQAFEIYLPPGLFDAMPTALLLRRFLRGYDDIGSDGGDGLRVFVYCPDAAAERVLARLRAIVESPALVTYRGSSG